MSRTIITTIQIYIIANTKCNKLEQEQEHRFAHSKAFWCKSIQHTFSTISYRLNMTTVYQSFEKSELSCRKFKNS